MILNAEPCPDTAPATNITAHEPRALRKTPPRGFFANLLMLVMRKRRSSCLACCWWSMPWCAPISSRTASSSCPPGYALWSEAFAVAEVRWELLERAIITLAIALAPVWPSPIPVGILLGVIMFRALILERALFPNIVALQAIPTLAIISLIQTALGFGPCPRS